MKNILKFILKRIALGLVTLWMVITITFFLLHMLPGDPFQDEKELPPQIKANLMQKYHLDKPLGVQYLYYLGNIVKGDLGESMRDRGRTVNDTIKEGFKSSADLGIRAIIFALIVGIPLGITAALKRGKYQDKIAMVIAIIGISVPSFVIAGLMHKYVVDIHNGFFIKQLGLPRMFRIRISGWDSFDKKILPPIALGLYTVALIARLLRGKMIEVMGQDYIRLAVAKGVKPVDIIWKHALRNAILPIVTIMGPTIAAVLTGSFVIEKAFTIPGLGKYYIDSITNRDYTMVLGVTVFYAIFLIGMMIVMDLVYALVDPKIKLGKGDEV